MPKKLFVAVLCLVFLLAAAPVPAEEEHFMSGDFTYTLLPDGTAAIIQYAGRDADLSIPAELDGHAVTAIGDQAFSFSDFLTSVTIPEGVTSIGNGAFLNCFFLRSVIVGGSVTSIGSGAFSNSPLTSVSLPDALSFIGINPFLQCSSLKEILVSPEHPLLSFTDGVLFCKPEGRLVFCSASFSAEEYTVPEGIISIDEGAFCGCSRLTKVILPEGVQRLGTNTFYNCSSLVSVTIPDSLRDPDTQNPFISCTSLKTATVSENHPMLTVRDGVLFDKTEDRLICYPGGLKAKKFFYVCPYI